MTYLAIDEQIADALEQLAQVRAISTKQLTEEALRTYLRAERQRAIEQESKAFVRLHPWLLENYAGQYAAIVDGQFVDHDVDQEALYLRTDARFPGAVVLIRQVTAEPDTTIHISSPRLAYD